jgi:hypothetical protein
MLYSLRSERRKDNIIVTVSAPNKPIIAYVERHPILAFLLVLMVGMAMRFIMLPTAGFALDLVQHYDWGLCANQYGVFGVYQCETQVTHPPLSPTMLGIAMQVVRSLRGDVSYFENNAPVVAALKIPNLLFETAIIGLFFYIAYQKAGVWWAALVSAALYWNLGWAVVTSWWGQNDATYSFFMLLTAYLLTRRRPRWMWIAYACGWLAKFQSIMFFPVLAILSLWRFGWRATIEGGVLGAFVFVLVVLPYYLGSGNAALTPFGGTVNLFPYITTGAHNFWFWVSGSSPVALLDSLKLFDGVSYFQAGLVLLVLGTALVCWRVWRSGEQGNEYLLLAAANFTFYMLPTQIQVRYLFPGLMFLALAMIRDWRLIALYIVASLAFTHNVFTTVWLGTGLLYYPSKLLFWPPVVDGLAMTVFYIVFMVIFLKSPTRREKMGTATDPQ